MEQSGNGQSGTSRKTAGHMTASEHDRPNQWTRLDSNQSLGLYQRDPVKERARQAVHQAVRKGRLSKPENCPSCGSRSELHAHHARGYTRPLDVDWLCRRCHIDIHNGTLQLPVPDYVHRVRAKMREHAAQRAELWRTWFGS